MDNGLVTKLHLGNFYVPYGAREGPFLNYIARWKIDVDPTQTSIMLMGN